MSDFGLDLIAVFICILAFVFVVTPVVGSMAAEKNDGYVERIGIGAGIILYLAIILVAIISTAWAAMRLTGAA